MTHRSNEPGLTERGPIVPILIVLLTMTMIGLLPEPALAMSQPRTTATRPWAQLLPPSPPADLATEYPQPQPVLHATFSDPDGGTGRVLYTILGPNGNVVVQDAAGLTVSSGSDSRYTIASGVLSSGVIYTWTARSFDGTYYSSASTDPNFVATSLSGGVTAAATNPWGCQLKTLNGHFSNPNIKAEAQTNCTSVPSGVTIEHVQTLYRSSWTGWRLVATNDSWCDSGSHSAGQPYPQCHSLWTAPRMQAYVWWNCINAGFSGQSYNYLNKDTSYIRSGGTTYAVSKQKETGPWNANGNVKCGA